MDTPLVTPNLLAQMRTPALPALSAAPVMPTMPQLGLPVTPLAIPAPSGARFNELGAALPSSEIRRNELGGYLPSGDTPDAVAAPHVQTQLERDQAERDRRVNTGSGIDQIHNPLLRGIARAGDIAASVFGTYIPGVRTIDALLPGTTLHHQVEINRAERNLANDQSTQKAADESAQSQAVTGHTDAATDLTKLQATGLPQQQADAHEMEQANVGNIESEEYARMHPLPDYELHDTPGGILKVNKKDGSAQYVTVDGKQVGAPLKTTKVQLKIGGVPHEVLVNEQTGDPIKDLGESGFKPQAINVNAGITALDRETKQFGTPYQKSLDASNGQLEKIADARAMINGNAESQGLGIPKVLTALVGGQGTGVRITQAELQSIAHARGLSGDVEGTLNKWAGKGALSKEQQRQLTQIMDDVKARLLQKQAIASQTLDAVNGASTRDEIISADKAARKQLSDLETSAGTSAPQAHVIQVGGKNYRYKGTGATDDMKNYTEVKP